MIPITEDSIALHSTCDIFQSNTNRSTFIDCLKDISSKSFWENIEIDGDGDRIIKSVLQGTLVIGMDGSYMPKLTACLGAFIMHCTNTGLEVKGCMADASPNADNYRGEFLGALGPLLVLLAVLMANPQVHCSQVRLDLHCDNKGVVTHGNQSQATIKADQVQADLFRLQKIYSRVLPLHLQWHHVNGHSDDTNSFTNLSLVQQLNVRCDEMACKHLLRSIRLGTFMDPVFSDEDITLLIESTKVRSSVRKEIYKHWVKLTARNLFRRRDKVIPTTFDLIHWDVMPKVMKEFPKTFQDWITRHISDFNGCNKDISLVGGQQSKMSVQAAGARTH